MEYIELKPLPPDAPTPTPRPADPTNQDLLAALLDMEGDAARLIREFRLSPRRYLAFAQDPEVVETLAAFDAMQERHHRITAQKRQAQAAEFLHLAMLETMSPVETRRAATALARLATHMLAPPRPHAPRVASPQTAVPQAAAAALDEPRTGAAPFPASPPPRVSASPAPRRGPAQTPGSPAKPDLPLAPSAA